MNSSGVYEIVNIANGKRYVGSAKHMGQRFREHRHGMVRGRHSNRHLQNAVTKHGLSAFKFRPLLICSLDQLLFYEQRAIDVLAPEYNLSSVAGNTLGTTRTAESRAKIAAKAKGRVWSDESKAKLSATLTGRKLSEAHRQTLIGNQFAVGSKHTEEWKAENSRRNLGKKRPKSPEYRAKIAAALRGRKATAEHRANQSAAQRGVKRGPYKPWSDETRARFKASMGARPNPLRGRKRSLETVTRMSQALRGVEHLATSTRPRLRQVVWLLGPIAEQQN